MRTTCRCLVHTKKNLLLFLYASFVFLFSANALSAQEVLSGRVLDGTGKPISGVNVSWLNSQKGTLTDQAGVFEINRISGAGALIFSHISYVEQRIEISNQTTVTVTLIGVDRAIDEVVVTGYTTQQKRDITGSVTVVDMQGIEEQPAVSVDRALQGMAAGVNVTSSGVPGTESTINIRGLTSFGDTKPLVIVDGIEQSLTHISPNDIASIQVLKDAGAAAIYGVRGANGVIIVSTKKGQSGKPSIQYEGSFNMTYPLPGNVFDLMNSSDYMEVYNIAYPGNTLFSKGMPDYTYRGPNGAGVGFEGDPEVDPSLYFYEKKNTGKNYIIQRVNKDREDWFHNLFQRANSNQHAVSVNGGTEAAKYFFGLGYANQEGTLYNSFYKRYTARVNTEFNLGKYIKVGENLSLLYKQNPSITNQSEFGFLASTFKMLPVVPLKDIMGNWAGSFGGPNLGTFGNPVAIQDRNAGKDLNYDWGIAGNTFMEATILKDFVARTSLGINYASYFDRNFSATQTENIQGNSGDNSLSIGSGYNSTLTFTNTVTYNKNIDVHRLQALVGTEAIAYMSRGVSGSASAFFSEDVAYLNLNNGTLNISNSSSVASNSLFSMFGRLDYSYDDRYIGSFTLRRDGSSKFGERNRYGVFPSFSAGWRLSQEAFLRDVEWLNDLKLRGSWGILGSQNNVNAANAYSLYASSLSGTSYDINGASTSVVQGFGQSRIGNMATGWEQNVVTNVGLDLQVLNNVTLTAEYYQKKINGLLFQESLPAVILGGATAPTVNIGDIQNNGIDIALAYDRSISNDFKYNVGVNFTSYNNKIVALPDPGFFTAGSQQGMGAIARNEVGNPMSAFYGYQIVGLFNTAEEIAEAPSQTAAQVGRFRYQDTNGDNVITADDRIFLGDPNPDFTYGINLGVTYKNLDLSTLLYGSQGNDIYNTTLAYLDFMQYYSGAKSNKLKNAWSETNKNTSVPKIESATSFSTNGTANSYFVEDGSFLKLRHVTLGYTVAPEKIQRLGLSKIRIYAQAANLFTFTKYSGLDPELTGDPSDFGIDLGNYPNNEMSVIFGINASF